MSTPHNITQFGAPQTLTTAAVMTAELNQHYDVLEEYTIGIVFLCMGIGDVLCTCV